MRLLLDTNILVPLIDGNGRNLPEPVIRALEDDDASLWASVASIWEVAIKAMLGRDDFHVEPGVLRRGLLDNGYGELRIGSEHAVAIAGLPPVHKDPFDRILVAQAQVEGITLLTVDPRVAQYPAPVRML